MYIYTCRYKHTKEKRKTTQIPEYPNLREMIVTYFLKLDHKLLYYRMFSIKNGIYIGNDTGNHLEGFTKSLSLLKLQYFSFSLANFSDNFFNFLN